MSDDKEYNEVKTICVNDYSIRLEILLKKSVDRTWEQCYQEALHKISPITFWRSSGAPTLNRIRFENDRAYTDSFSNNELTKKEAKDFLNEFNTALKITNTLYENLQRQKKLEKEKLEKERIEQQKKLEELNDYFNN